MTWAGGRRRADSALIGAVSAALLLGLAGCSGDEAPAVGSPPVDGGASDACPPGERPLEGGGCVVAGVEPQSCGAGFNPANGGCDPILPPSTCPSGKTAIPGDAACRELAPCGADPWGEIPVDAVTQYVDGAWGGASDGSTAQPWKTVQEGIDAAAPGAIVAIAQGSYVEDLIVADKPVRLWGRCPSMTEIVGGAAAPALYIRGASGGTEVHALALRGALDAAWVATNGPDVVFDSVWLHDTAGRGFDIEDAFGATHVIVRDSLIERTTEFAVYVYGTDVEIDRSAVRDTQELAAEQAGFGATVRNDVTTGRLPSLTVHSSLFDRNHDVTIDVVAGSVTIEGSVIRDTQPNESVQKFGQGLVAVSVASETPTQVDVQRSVIEGNRFAGVLLSGVSATIESTTIRDTAPQASDLHFGRGIVSQNDSSLGIRGSLQLRSSLVERNLDAAVFVAGSDAVVESTWIRDTSPRAVDGAFGRSIAAEADPDAGERVGLTLSWSVLERGYEVGLSASGADLTAEGSIIRDVRPLDTSMLFGRGMSIERVPFAPMPSNAIIHGCLVEQTIEVGIAVIDSTARIESSTVRATAATPVGGRFGDGVDAISVYADTSVTIIGSRIDENERAGISSFGASIDIGSTTFECNAIQLDGETFSGRSFAFHDLGGNACGCAGAAAACQVSTSDLDPPSPLQP